MSGTPPNELGKAGGEVIILGALDDLLDAHPPLRDELRAVDLEDHFADLDAQLGQAVSDAGSQPQSVAMQAGRQLVSEGCELQLCRRQRVGAEAVVCVEAAPMRKVRIAGRHQFATRAFQRAAVAHALEGARQASPSADNSFALPVPFLTASFSTSAGSFPFSAATASV